MAFKRAPPGTSLGQKGVALQADVPIPGTKRWIDGSLLVSTGHAQLDAYLGGGLPVGTTVLVEEDVRNLHAPSLVRQFIAEGVAVDQRIILAGLAPDAALGDFLRSTPLNVSRGSKDLAALNALGLSAAAAADAPGDSAESEGPAWDSQGHQLNIAWQYKKYLAPADGAAPKAGSRGAKFGHSYDLNRTAPPAVLAAAAARTVSVASAADPWGDAGDEGAAARGVASALLKGVAAALADGGAAGSPGEVARVVVLGLCGPAWPGFTGPAPGVPFAASSGAAALSESQLRLHAPALRLAAELRRLAQRHRSAASTGRGAAGGAVLLASAPTHLLPPGAAARLRNAFDCVVKLHAFDDPPPPPDGGAAGAGGGGGAEQLVTVTGAAPEFADYTGVLLLRRVPTRGGLTGLAPPARTFAFRHDRHRLVIDVPHLPPELAAPAPAPSTKTEHGAPSSGGAGSTRGAAHGLSCAASAAPGGLLDF